VNKLSGSFFGGFFWKSHKNETKKGQKWIKLSLMQKILLNEKFYLKLRMVKKLKKVYNSEMDKR
jgi:hypothetical protein